MKRWSTNLLKQIIYKFDFLHYQTNVSEKQVKALHGMMSIRKRLLINSYISNKKVEMNQCLLKKKIIMKLFELFWRLLPLGHLKVSRWHKNILQDSLVSDERVMRETSWPHIYCFENLSNLHISMYDIHQYREVVSVSIFTPTTGILQLQTCAAEAQIWPCQVTAGSLQLLAGAWKTNEPNKLLRELVLDY